MKILVVYATKYGQTEKIANRIADVVRHEGADARAVAVQSLPRQFDFAPFDTVFIAAPVYYGKFPKRIVRFITRNLASLRSVHNVLIAVSLSAVFKPDEAEGYVHWLVDRTGWLPDTFEAVGGAERFTQYGWFIGRVMRKIATENGRGGDFSKDREYTDWPALDEFVRQRIERLRAAAPTSSVAAVQP